MKNKIYLISVFVLFTLWAQATTDPGPLDILNINLNIWNKENSGIELNLTAKPNSAVENNPTAEPNPEAENYGLENKYYGSGYVYYSDSGKGGVTFGDSGSGEDGLAKMDKGNCKCGVKNGVSKSSKISGRIKHGEFVDPHEYPWVVPAIDTKVSKYPGYTTSIISSKTILTCGHCIPGSDLPPERIEYDKKWTGLWAGSHNFTTDEQGVQKMKAERFIKMDPYIADIGLIILKDSLTWTENVKPICLPNTDDTLYDRIPVIGIGYGDQGYPGSGGSTVPKELLLTTISEDSKHCAVKEQLCSLPHNNSSGFGMGDSGGPIIALKPRGYYNQIGVISGGGIFHVSTRVATYLKWIRENMVGETCPPP